MATKNRKTKNNKKKIVTVNDKMQKGYRYALSAPTGRNFDPEFRPQLTPAEMLRLGVFGGKYMTDCAREFRPRVSAQLVRTRKASRQAQRSRAELLRRRRKPAAFGMAQEGMALSGRPTGLVSMVLPLLHGTPHPGRGRPADQALEGDPASHPAD